MFSSVATETASVGNLDLRKGGAGFNHGSRVLYSGTISAINRVNTSISVQSYTQLVCVCVSVNGIVCEIILNPSRMTRRSS